MSDRTDRLVLEPYGLAGLSPRVSRGRENRGKVIKCRTYRVVAAPRAILLVVPRLAS
jgi:hypothetical protein